MPPTFHQFMRVLLHPVRSMGAVVAAGVVLLGLAAAPAMAIPSPPSNITAPTVAGTATVGQALTAAPGTWGGSPAPDITYQWQRCTESAGVPGVDWVSRQAAAENLWFSVAWGGQSGDQKFAAVAFTWIPAGQGGPVTPQVMTSPDGVNWTTQAAANKAAWTSVTWGGPTGQETFVAVGSAVGEVGGEQVMTSPDGVTWTRRAAASTNEWGSVTWGGPAGQEKFVAVAQTGTGNRVMTSPDGITWTSQTSAADNDWTSVTWGGPAGQEKFVAVAKTGTGNRVMTSPDGVSWTAQASAANNDWQSVTWGGPAGQEKFVAVATTGTNNGVMTSPDGVTWTARTPAANNAWSSVTWGGPAGAGTFVAVSYSGAGNRAMTSPDGITWTARASASDNNWTSVAWGGPSGEQDFVAVAASSTGERVMTSGPALECTDIANATDAQYLLQAADEGMRIRVVVTGTNTGGSAQAMSAVVGPVRPADPTPSGNSGGTGSGASSSGTQVPTAVTPSLSAAVLSPTRRLVSGQVVRIAVRVTNRGKAGATGVTASLRIPASLAIASAPGAIRSGRTVAFRIGTVGAGNAVTKALTLRAVSARRAVGRVVGTTRAAGISSVAARPWTFLVAPRPARARVTG